MLTNMQCGGSYDKYTYIKALLEIRIYNERKNSSSPCYWINNTLCCSFRMFTGRILHLFVFAENDLLLVEGGSDREGQGMNSLSHKIIVKDESKLRLLGDLFSWERFFML